MGVAAVMSTVRTDWKEKATKEFPKSRIAEQKEKIDSLDKETASLERHQKDAAAAIEAAIDVATTSFDPLAKLAKDRDLDVLRIGVDELETAVALGEFIAERRLRKV